MGIWILEGLTGWVILALLAILWRVYFLKSRILWRVCLLMLIATLILVTWSSRSENTIHQSGNLETTVQLMPDSVKIDGDYWRGTVQNLKTGEKFPATYYFSSLEEKSLWTNNESLPPRYLKVIGELKVPEPARHLGGFDYREYLKRNKMNYTLSVQKMFCVSDSFKQFDLKYWLSALRYRLVHWFQMHQPAPLVDYSLSLLLADQRLMDQEALQAFKNMGLIHFLAISGFHISYFIRLVQHFFWRVGITRETTDGLLVILMVSLLLLLGWQISVFRAVSQSIIKIISRLTGRRLTSLDCWSLSLILAVWLFPGQWIYLGFQMTYLLSGVLIISQDLFRKKQMSIFLQSFFTSLLCLIFSIPILTYHFFEFKPLSLILSILFAPLLSGIIMPLLIVGLIVTVVCSLLPRMAIILNGINLFFRFFNYFIVKLASLLDFSWVTGRWVFASMVLFYLMSIGILVKFEEGKKPLKEMIALLLIIALNQLSPLGLVAMIDVGQGDCLLIKEPFKNSAIMIDTGGKINYGKREPWQMREKIYSLGRDTIAPALRYFGIQSLEYIIITHADADHCGELLSVGQELPVNNIWLSKESYLDQNLYSRLKQPPFKQTKMHLAKIGDQIKKSLVSLHIIGPTSVSGDVNRDSLVIFGRIGGQTFLLMGDADTKAEDKLIAMYPHLQADILKIGHHGSDTSTGVNFLEKISPQEAWISVGKNNRYNHPHPEVIERLETSHIKIRRTDHSGSYYYIYVPHFTRPNEVIWSKKIKSME